MAEPGKEAAPLPAAVAESILETDTRHTALSASQDTETAASGTATLDSALPKAESAHRAPPQETAAVAAVAAPEQTTTEADGQPQKVAALPPQAETPAPAAPTPPPPRKQEGGVPKQASSVHEEKGASKATEEEGQEKPARRRWRRLRAAVRLLLLRPKSGETKPPTPPGGKQPVSGPEEKKPPPQKDSGSAVRVPSKPEAGKGEGATKPAELDGKRPDTLPPPAPETSSQETTAAAEAEKQIAAPAPQQPPRKEEGGAPEPAPSVQEEKDAAPAAARAPKGEENKPARRRWRWLQAAVRLLFLRPKGGETKQPVLSGLEDTEEKPTPPPVDSVGKPAVDKGEDEMKPSAQDDKKPASGEMPPPVDSVGKPAVEKEGEDEMKSSAQDGKKPASGEEEQKPAAKKKPSRKDSAGEKSKGRRDENETQAGKATPQLEGDERPSLKKLQKAIRLVQCLMSLCKKHSSSQEKKPETASDPGREYDYEAKPTEVEEEEEEEEEEEKKKKTTTEDRQHHPNWRREEVRLEHMLEEAFTRLLATEYFKELSSVRQKCLLTFSVFELASEVKKQAMIYWWVAEFNLRHGSDRPAHAGDDDAEGIFFMLSDHGFLVPIKNWCSKAIHGCQVNPLVHWMLKRQARGDGFAELDDKGSPAKLQLKSSILCLTAGNRPVLQSMRIEDEAQAQSQPQGGTKKDESRRPQSQGKGKGKGKQQPMTKDEEEAQAVGSESKAPTPSHDKDEDPTQVKAQLAKGTQNIQPKIFEGKRVILNVNAHVYPVSRSAFLKLAECLVVLQLGRWNNVDDKTYMEVDGLESRNAIGVLKNLRYLGLRGLSRLTVLPKGIESLRKLVILDMRGCQNLVKVEANAITQLKQLTHLDLTECYMLEYIGREITSLTELQVFKGFVFATGTQGKKACRIQDLKRLKKLQKLTVSITTDANVGKGEMAELRHLPSLRKLTITWSEIPSILKGDEKKVGKKREDLIERWTSFQLPKDLMKLDIRCYPKRKLQLEAHEKLEKLYLRGGDMESFSTHNKSTPIKTLRLRYLKNFQMGWEDIRSELQQIEYVEIVVNKDAAQREEGKSDDEVTKPIKAVMMNKIPEFTLDGNGVWTKDRKEEDNIKKSSLRKNKASEPSEPTEDSSAK